MVNLSVPALTAVAAVAAVAVAVERLPPRLRLQELSLATVK